MGKTKIKHLRTIGFEKRFDSLTEARDEMAGIWPEVEKLLDTPAGKVLIQYSLLGQTDDELETTMKTLNEGGRGAVLDSKGEETLLARAFGVKGSVCLVSWGGAGFGWELAKPGFTAFIEAWPGRFFKRGEKVDQKCRVLGWSQCLEVDATRGQRRMGPVDDLKRFLARGANETAAMLTPQRLAAEAGVVAP